MKLTNASLRARIDGTLDRVAMTNRGISWTRGVIRKIGIERQGKSRYLLVGMSDVERYLTQKVWQLEPEWPPSMFSDSSSDDRLEFSSIPLSKEATVAIDERLVISTPGRFHALSFPGRSSLSAVTIRNSLTEEWLTYFASDASRASLRDASYRFAL